MHKKRLILIASLSAAVLLLTMSAKQGSTLFKEISIAQSNYTARQTAQQKLTEYSSIRDEVNQLLKMQIMPFSEAELYQEMSAISDKIVITDVSYTKPQAATNQNTVNTAPAHVATNGIAVAPMTTTPTEAPATNSVTPTPQSAPIDKTTMYITLRGDVLPFLANLDQKIQYSIVNYTKTSKSETAVIKVGGGE